MYPQIFFPRSMARDSGNNARDPPVIMASKTPADSPSLPNYHGHNHVHHESASSPPFFISSPQNSITGARLAAFRYPVSPPPHSPHHLSPQRDSFRRYSAESEATPEYESETESNAIPKRPMSVPASQVPSEDTIWERQGQNATSTWPYPEGRNAYNRGKVVVLLPRSQEAGAPTSSSQLHPYVCVLYTPRSINRACC